MKEYQKITIPEGITYLGDIPNFELPNGIFNKVLTGCGATTVALKDNNPTILVAPRKALLENKYEQYPDLLFWVTAESLQEKTDIFNYISKVKIPKLLVTYDSFSKLKELLKDSFKDYRVVVDEFHRMMKDATFKSWTIMDLVNELKDCSYVTLLSATPIPDKFIEKSDYLLYLNKYVADWPSIERIKLNAIKTNSPVKVLYSIIDQYKNNEYYPLYKNGELLFKSTEAIFFINSVRLIINTIKTNKLKPDEVNILIADTENNRKLLKKKLGSKYVIGKASLKDEKNKTFTFCTSTAFDGVDFYSDNALLFAISCSNINATLLDLAVDMQQIAGRQRLLSNPGYNSITFIYSESFYNNLNEANIYKHIQEEKEEAEQSLFGLNQLPDKMKFRIKDKILDEDIDTFESSAAIYLDEDTNTFHVNDFRLIAEEDSLLLLNEFTSKGIPVVSRYTETYEISSQYLCVIDKHIKDFYLQDSVNKALRDNCKDENSFIDAMHILKANIPEEYYNALIKLGYSKSKSLGYNFDKIINELNKESIDTEYIKKDILSFFKDGFLDTKTIKSRLTFLYNSKGYAGVITANKIEELLPVKKTSKKFGDKRIYGYKLI